MKTILIALTLASSLSYANEEVSMSWVDQKIQEIKPKRTGLNNTTLTRLKSPFIIVRPEVKDSGKSGDKKVIVPKKKLLVVKKDMNKEPLTLQMVLNSSALVNDKWLKENDLIRGFKLIQIQNNFVVLKSKKREIKLFIAQKNKNLKISTK